MKRKLHLWKGLVPLWHPAPFFLCQSRCPLYSRVEESWGQGSRGEWGRVNSKAAKWEVFSGLSVSVLCYISIQKKTHIKLNRDFFKNLRAFAWNIFSETKEKPRFASKGQITVNPLGDDSPNAAFYRKNSYEYKNRCISRLYATNEFFLLYGMQGEEQRQNNKARCYYHVFHNTICIWKYPLTVHSFLLHKPMKKKSQNTLFKNPDFFLSRKSQTWSAQDAPTQRNSWIWHLSALLIAHSGPSPLFCETTLLLK